MKDPEHLPLLTTSFSFVSGTGEIEMARYINEYAVEFREDTDDGSRGPVVGCARVSLVLLTKMINDQGYPPSDIFDHTAQLWELGETIYDFKKSQYRKAVRFGEETMNHNLLFIERMELLPEWRGRSLGRVLLKDIIERFVGCCGVVALKAFPLQSEYVSDNPTPGSEEHWRAQMALDQFPTDHEQASYQMFQYYQTLGFERVRSTPFFVFYPERINPVFDAIELV